MTSHKICMLSAGKIGNFYTTTLHNLCGRDWVYAIYSCSSERADKFAKEWGIPKSSSNLDEGVQDSAFNVVLIGLPNEHYGLNFSKSN
jgi:predicted dehydrogenase